jgi:hypothetical protein
VEGLQLEPGPATPVPAAIFFLSPHNNLKFYPKFGHTASGRIIVGHLPDPIFPPRIYLVRRKGCPRALDHRRVAGTGPVTKR